MSTLAPPAPAVSRAGAAELLIEVFARSHMRLLAHALRLADGHRADAEDLVQGAYLRALEDRGAELADASPDEATFVLHDLMDQAARNRRRRRARGSEDLSTDPADLEHVAGAGEDPAVAAERHAESDALLMALAALEPDERRAVVLVAAGYRYAEVAGRLGRDVPGVAALVRSARLALAGEREALASGRRCRRIQRHVAAALDAELPPRAAGEVGEHARRCGACRAVRAAMLAQRRALAAALPAPCHREPAEHSACDRPLRDVWGTPAVAEDPPEAGPSPPEPGWDAWEAEGARSRGAPRVPGSARRRLVRYGALGALGAVGVAAAAHLGSPGARLSAQTPLTAPAARTPVTGPSIAPHPTPPSAARVLPVRGPAAAVVESSARAPARRARPAPIASRTEQASPSPAPAPRALRPAAPARCRSLATPAGEFAPGPPRC